MDMDWTTLAAQRAEYVSDRLRGLMSSALRFLRVELGLDLGLKPEQCPSWMILSTALVGLLLLLAMFGACGRRKRRVVPVSVKPVKPSPVIVTPAKPPKTPKPEPSEPKKKNKKKAADKKAQVNGQAVAQPQEETKVSEERKKPAPAPEQPPVDAKTKKPKKKTKPEVKSSKDVSSTDGKEPDEGAWETKISNKEKRQQRKKEKGPGDDNGSPQAGDHVNQKVQPTAVSPTAVSKKKKEATRPKTGKPEPNVSPVTSNWNNGSAVNGGEWTEVTGKQSTQQNSSNSDKWSAGRKKNRDENNWKPDSDGSWTGLDGRVKSDPSPVNFSSLGLNTKADKTGIKPCVETRYENAPVDSEWSNFNGLSTADPGSDWNAPTEAWGNYEEPKTDALVSKDTPVSVLQVEPNNDKDVADSAESGKSKRRRKKKKTEDDGSATEIIREDLGTKLLHPPQKEVLAKQNVPPPSSQKKPDQNWEAPKQVQKKKARRET